MRKLKVLVACEESQEVCKAFRELGHIAFSCDLQECSGGHPEWHIQGDALNFLEPYDTGSGYTMNFCTQNGAWHGWHAQWYRDAWWDLIIAHPPCTYLSSVGALHLFNSDHTIKDKNREECGWRAREFFMTIYDTDCKHIAVENPAPLSHFKLPGYSQIIEPYFFGDPWKKRTCLWLRGLPKLLPNKEVAPLGCWTIQSGGSTCRIKLKCSGGAKTAKERSKTFPGIAKAMAAQWSAYILNEDGDNNG